MKMDIMKRTLFVVTILFTFADAYTLQQENAIREAKNYLKVMAFSRQGLIDQLSSEVGGQYDVSDATLAVDSLNVDWNYQAVRSAKNYLKIMGFSCRGLIDQLSADTGGRFTPAEAEYGAQEVGLCK